MKRIRGLKSLLQAAVEHGSRAVEAVQIEVAKTPFDLLEKVPPLKLPVAGVRLLYNTGVGTTHTMIRLVNKVVGDTLDVVLDQVAPAAGAAEGPGKAESAVAAEGPGKGESTGGAEGPGEAESTGAPGGGEAPAKGEATGG